MRTIQASEAKSRFSALLKAVEQGEEIDITLHGRSVARLVPPYQDEKERRAAAVDRLLEWRRTLPPTGMTVEDILSARDEGRK